MAFCISLRGGELSLYRGVIMRAYDYGTKTLKSNSSANNSYGKVSLPMNTTKTNDSQLDKLKNKAYFRYGKGSLQNKTRPKTF